MNYSLALSMAAYDIVFKGYKRQPPVNTFDLTV